MVFPRTVRYVLALLLIVAALPLAFVGGHAAASTVFAGTFTPVAPTRILDTRSGLGAPAAAVAPNRSVRLKIAGTAGLPATGVGAVVLNVTVTQANRPGYITAYPDGGAMPASSSLNILPGKDVANLVTVQVGSNGYVDLFNGSASTLHLVADLNGWFTAGTPTAAGAFGALPPARLLDTRTMSGAVPAHGAVRLRVTGRGGVPATNVAAVTMNVTVTQPTAAGYITVYPAGQDEPLASNVNFLPGRDVPNAVIARVGDSGDVMLYNGSDGTVQLIADVFGYYVGGTPTVPGTLVSLTPIRVLDTRVGLNAPCACPVGASSTLQAAIAQVPNGAAVVANVTATAPATPGYVTVFPGKSSAPLASNLNLRPGEDVPNLVTVPSGPSRLLDLMNGGWGPTHLVADLSGYYLPAATAQDPVMSGSPITSAPTPPAPTSSVPTTSAPAPTASAPTTSAAAPTVSAPSTSAPAPTSSAPAPTSSAPTSSAPTTTAPAPTTSTTTVPAPAPTGLPSPRPTPSPNTPLTNQIWPDKRVWVSYIGQGLADYSQMAGMDNFWGDLYSLDLVHGDYTTPMRPTEGVPRALQAGVTGIHTLLFNNNHGGDFTTDWMKAADPTWSDSDPNNNFMVSPELEISDVADATRIIQEFVTAAQGHPSAGRINGKLLIFVYSMRNLTPAQWSQVRTNLGSVNSQIFMIGDLATEASQTGYQLDTSLTDPWFSVFDANWDFDDSVDHIWDPLLQHLNANNRSFAGGFMPGYDRETCDNDADCGHLDAYGTKKYRSMWDRALASGSSWQTIVTWSDMVERTEVQTTSNWNATRSDVTAFYSAKLRGIAFPNPQAELYITTPEQIRLGDSVQAEGLVLNGGTRPVTVKTTVVDNLGLPVGTTVTTTVQPGQAADATTLDTETVLSLPAGRFFRARADMYDAQTGVLLESVTSAPIVVYTGTDNPTPNLHRLYYSVPAAKALPLKPTLALNGNPVTSTSATATVLAPAGTSVRFSEVLQNTRQVGNGFSNSAYTVSVPMAPRTIIGWQVTSAAPNGFYVGRVIDEQERVGYSDPVFVS